MLTAPAASRGRHGWMKRILASHARVSNCFQASEVRIIIGMSILGVISEHISASLGMVPRWWGPCSLIMQACLVPAEHTTPNGSGSCWACKSTNYLRSMSMTISAALQIFCPLRMTCVCQFLSVAAGKRRVSRLMQLASTTSFQVGGVMVSGILSVRINADGLQ